MSNLKKNITAYEKHSSIFEQEIRKFDPPVAAVFKDGDKIMPVAFDKEGDTLSGKDAEKVNEAFAKTVAKSNNKLLYASGVNGAPLSGKKVAVLFSGGPASGGHNVVAGLKRVLGDKNTLMGVIAGPKGLIEGNLFEITDEAVAEVLNTGGFDFLGSDRTKIKTDEQFAAVKKTCEDNSLDAIVVVGGDDSNTNAAVLAEYLSEIDVQVIGVPKTIDGDLQVGKLLPISFGFDTATKIYAEMVGNILQDTPSSRKYWHFVKLMGRSASHVALEVAMQTKPAICLISEEVAEKKMSLDQIVSQIAEAVVARSKKGINHGVVLVPEGLIEFVPEMNSLIAELNDKIAENQAEVDSKDGEAKREYMISILTDTHAKLMASLPVYIQDMLLADRDSHGNLQVSLIPTEKLLIDMTAKKVAELDEGVKFATHNHFFGYEGRCGAPSLFDAAYTFNLGLCAGSLILAGKTGYMAGMTSFENDATILAIPLSGLINIERRHGQDEMVIEKALVELDSEAFKYFAERRADWASEDLFCSPGPRQLWGPVSKQVPVSVAFNQGYNDLIFNI